MKAVTYAAAAALVGAASANQHAHEHLHKRQDWSAWSSDPATSISDWTTSTSSSYTDWDPKSTSTSTYDWTSSASTSTSVTDWDPKKKHSTTTTTTPSSSGWGDWETSSTTTTTTTTSGSWSWDPEDPKESCTATVTDWALGTTTESATVYTTSTGTWDYSWGPFTETTTVTVTMTWGSSSTTPVAAASTSSAWAWSYDPSECSVTVLTSTGAPVWLPDPTWTSVSTLYVTPVAAATTTTTTGWADSASWDDWTSTTTTTTTTTGWPAWSSSTDPADWEWTSTTTSSASTWPAWTSSSSSAASTATGHAVIAPKGNNWAMTYSPYTASGGCKDQGTISADIAKIASKGFTSVRVYSTDCNTLEFVGQACSDNGLKIILGVFISSTGISGAGQQVTDIIAWAQWDIVELIVVGNEAVFNGYCSASDLAWFISSVKSQAQGAGYTGPVTTTEPLTTWQTVGTTFCSAVDVVAGNLYAFFNAQTTCDQAGTFIESEITVLEGICSGLDVYVMETGWPSAGECNGAACPGWSEQATAITSIQGTSGAKVVFFTFEDDEWKTPGQFGVEQHWGCVDVFPDVSGTSTTTSAYSSATGW